MRVLGIGIGGLVFGAAFGRYAARALRVPVFWTALGVGRAAYAVVSRVHVSGPRLGRLNSFAFRVGFDCSAWSAVSSQLVGDGLPGEPNSAPRRGGARFTGCA